MWVTWTLVVLAVLLWFGVSWLSALVEKYSHSLESISVLAILGVASLWFGRQLLGNSPLSGRWALPWSVFSDRTCGVFPSFVCGGQPMAGSSD